MADSLQIRSLIAIWFLIVGRKLYLKAYGHPQVLLLSLMDPNYKKGMKEAENVQGVQMKGPMLSKSGVLGESASNPNPGPSQSLLPHSLPSPGFWIREDV